MSAPAVRLARSVPPETFLVAATLIWGTTFVLVKEAVETVPPLLLLAVRFALATLVLVPWARFDRQMLRHGIIVGIITFAAFITQVLGLTTIDASRGAFITGLNVILVPVTLALAFRQKVGGRAWLGAALGVVGLALFSLQSGALGLSAGDVWVLACALWFAFQVIYLGRWSPLYNSLSFTWVQMATAAVLSWAFHLLGVACGEVDSICPSIAAVEDLASPGVFGGLGLAVLPVLIYLGVVATALTILLQVYGQRWVPPGRAALIYLLEPVFASAFAFLTLGEVLRPAEWAGAALILAGMFTSERD